MSHNLVRDGWATSSRPWSLRTVAARNIPQEYLISDHRRRCSQRALLSSEAQLRNPIKWNLFGLSVLKRKLGVNPTGIRLRLHQEDSEYSLVGSFVFYFIYDLITYL